MPDRTHVRRIRGGDSRSVEEPRPERGTQRPDGGAELVVAARRRDATLGSAAMKRLLHLMNYHPLGTRAFDHFILEYAKQATARSWSVTFGFIAEQPAEFGEQIRAMSADWVLFDAPFTWTAARRLKKALANRKPDVLQTSFLSAF